jgi:hypothetical protein
MPVKGLSASQRERGQKNVANSCGPSESLRRAITRGRDGEEVSRPVVDVSALVRAVPCDASQIRDVQAVFAKACVAGQDGRQGGEPRQAVSFSRSDADLGRLVRTAKEG